MMYAGALLYIQHHDRARVLSFAKDGEEVLPPHILHRRNIYYCVEEKKYVKGENLPRQTL